MEWRKIEGYSKYSVSSEGSVRNDKTGRILKTQIVDRGVYYCVVRLSENGIVKTQLVHRLVAQAFPEICGEWFEGCVIDHLNADGTDNRCTNLKIGTQKDNCNNQLFKNKMSEFQKTRTGWTHTEETKRKISESMKRRSK